MLVKVVVTEKHVEKAKGIRAMLRELASSDKFNPSLNCPVAQALKDVHIQLRTGRTYFWTLGDNYRLDMPEELQKVVRWFDDYYHDPKPQFPVEATIDVPDEFIY